MFRDSELHDQSRFYKLRHWLRDGGLQFLCSRVVIGIACCCVSFVSFAGMAVIYLNTPAGKFNSRPPTVVDTKRFKTMEEYKVIAK